MVRPDLTRWLYAPPLSGRLAVLSAILLAAFPTLIRAAVTGMVVGCEYTPYLPFVLVAALLLPWWLAATVALGSVATLGTLIMHPAADLECFLSAAALFLAASACIITFVVLVRKVVRAIQPRGADESSGGIVFSLEKGQVWASWYGQGPPVLLGSQSRVSEMMEDFLAQGEVAKRLNNWR
jgi:hypothetical protein